MDLYLQCCRHRPDFLIGDRLAVIDNCHSVRQCPRLRDPPLESSELIRQEGFSESF